MPDLGVSIQLYRSKLWDELTFEVAIMMTALLSM